VSTKDIRTSYTQVNCDVCGRTLLRGERAETYLAGGARRSVCELCSPRALHEGWIREGSAPSYEPREALPERRSLLGRLRTRREGEGIAAPPRANDADGRSPHPPLTREPRHVHAIPTSAEHKVASAIEAFNASEHPRTVAGVARSLGAPGVSVRPSAERPSVVNVVVSWELCWYRYEIDLSDDGEGVRRAGQGYELEELSPEEMELNAAADERGALTLD
jgi:hypothetical protein